MSFTFSDSLIEKARVVAVSLEEVIAELKQAMPLAMAVYDRLSDQVRFQGGIAIHAPQPLSADAPVAEQERMMQERTELTRIAASDAMRRAVQASYGFEMCFQNCHRVIVRLPGDEQTDDQWRRETSLEAQILNQAKGMEHC